MFAHHSGLPTLGAQAFKRTVASSAKIIFFIDFITVMGFLAAYKPIQVKRLTALLAINERNQMLGQMVIDYANTRIGAQL